MSYQIAVKSSGMGTRWDRAWPSVAGFGYGLVLALFSFPLLGFGHGTMIPWFVAAAPASIIPMFAPLLPFVWAYIFRFARGGESTRDKFYGLITAHYVGAIVVAAIHPPYEDEWRYFWRMWDYYPLAVLLWLAVYLFGNWLVWHWVGEERTKRSQLVSVCRAEYEGWTQYRL